MYEKKLLYNMVIIIIYCDMYYINRLREFKLDINNEISGNISKQF